MLKNNAVPNGSMNNLFSSDPTGDTIDNHGSDESLDEQTINDNQDDFQFNPEYRDDPFAETNEEAKTESKVSNPSKNGNKQDESRYEYWQSQADQYRKELEEMRTYTPIVKYLQSNPAALDAIEAHLTGKAVQPASMQQQEELKPPQKPNVPQNYDPLDTDPNSESYKYRIALERYYEEKDAYRDKLLEKELTPYRKVIEQEQQRLVERQQEALAVQHLMQTRKWDQNKANEFIRFTKDPQNMINLPEYFEWKMARDKAEKANAKQTNQPKKNLAQFGPAPAAIQPSVAQRNVKASSDRRNRDIFATASKR